MQYFGGHICIVLFAGLYLSSSLNYAKEAASATPLLTSIDLAAYPVTTCQGLFSRLIVLVALILFHIKRERIIATITPATAPARSFMIGS